MDRELLNDFAAENNVRVIEDEFLPLWFMLECTYQSSGNALELANLAYESKAFAAAEVSFYGSIQTCTLTYNDANFGSQWNLTETYGISFDGVPQITTGSPSVKVAVVDNSIRLDHPDMPIVNSWDATTGTSPGKIYYYSESGKESHGTFMTGDFRENSEEVAGL